MKPLNVFIACEASGTVRDAFRDAVARMRAEHGIDRDTIPRQTLQPHEFGTAETKATVLWLDRLPPLQPTNRLSRRDKIKGRVHHESPTGDTPRWWRRSLTDKNIAAAMAAQWGAL